MRSKRTLLVLTVVSIAMYIWAEHSHVTKKAPHFDDKLAAAELMKTMMDSLRQFQYANGIFPDEINDPNLTALIGQQYTRITTDIGDLDSKTTALNPNMAAVFINYFKEAGLEEGDIVAAGMTGSLPGMNLAFYAACEVLSLKPIVITSVGASSWGANDPYYTWLDMEHRLMETGLISRRSIAASYGGGEDLGGRLSPEGREYIRKAADRNDLRFIEEPNLEASVALRMSIYDDMAEDEKIKLYVNIGGGLASIGHGQNSDLIPVGVSSLLPILNYPRKGVIHHFSESGVPVAHIVNIHIIANNYNLPRSPSPLPEPGSGSLFSEIRYNLFVTVIALLVVVATLIAVLLFDRRLQQMDRPGADPDTLV
ncbi:MAG: poly-gamma-glutamate system protein [Candidatus Electryonea clarkiae]|nr:poly-gamma-glutamate system protein [Candidatus Electryonea clarkiae]MDP8288003.1 poly-gamma-glutamate system protein [Candidatus Electryonea clarkiae]